MSNRELLDDAIEVVDKLIRQRSNQWLRCDLIAISKLLEEIDIVEELHESGCRATVGDCVFQVNYSWSGTRDDFNIEEVYAYSIFDTRESQDLYLTFSVTTIDSIDDQVAESIARGDDL